MTNMWRKHLLEVLSYVFIQLCKRNDPFTTSGEKAHCSFNSTEACPMKIEPYLIWIANCTNCSNESLIFALIYIDKLIAKNPRFIVTSQNVKCLVLTSIVIAVKFYDDHFYKYSFYAQVGGVSCRRLKSLEMLFLKEINFELFVDNTVYSRYRKSLKKAVLNKPLYKLKLAHMTSEGAGHIQAFGSKLHPNNLSYTEREIRYSEGAKPVNMPINSKLCSHNIHHQGGNSYNKSTGTQLVNLPWRCFEKRPSYWQVLQPYTSDRAYRCI